MAATPCLTSTAVLYEMCEKDVSTWVIIVSVSIDLGVVEKLKPVDKILFDRV